MITGRIVALILLILYGLLSLIFIIVSDISVYKAKKSIKILDSLFENQITLFSLLDDILQTSFNEEEALNELLFKKNYALLNRRIAATCIQFQNHIKKHSIHEDKTISFYNAFENNSELIRDEVYIYNKYVDNVNSSATSFFFALVSAIKGYYKQDKI